MAAIAAGAYALLRWKPFRVEVVGDSMRPTLERGAWVLGTRADRLRRGAIVVLDDPRRPGFELVKRLVAIAGDRAPDGHVLGARELWVEGDAPEASTDSRSFGPVDLGSVRGRLRLVYWPPGRRKLL